jgi:1-deoxy-D-xylulose-5-phosphate reductoisomerase
MKTVNIFGSTGSIGTQALNIIKQYSNIFKVVGLTCGENISLFNKQVKIFKPEIVCIKNKKDISLLDFQGKVFCGSDGLREFANYRKVDISLISIVGTDGIIPAYEAISNSRLIALANKECLVSAGKFIMEKAVSLKVPMIPVDSEHSAIYQCLQNKNEVERIILTASGGPFYNFPKEKFKSITVEMALNHPTWDMGSKITIDSSTLMNKGLEIIEAKWLFGIEADKIDVLIHPQSIVHSMVEYQDGAILAQLGIPNMEIPISYALFYPFRAKLNKKLDLTQNSLQFYHPDYDKFPTLKFAFKALELGKGFPAAINKANEVAVKRFLKKEIGFTDIFEIIESVFKFEFPKYCNSLEDVFKINKEVERIL